MFKPLMSISGVVGVVETASDGTILTAELPDGDGKSEAALAVLTGGAADQIAALLNLGTFERGVGRVGRRRMVIFKCSVGYVGLVLSDQASPALVGDEAARLLQSECDDPSRTGEA